MKSTESRRIGQTTSSPRNSQAALTYGEMDVWTEPDVTPARLPYQYELVEVRKATAGAPGHTERIGLYETFAEAQHNLRLLFQYPALLGVGYEIRPLAEPIQPASPCRVKGLMALLNVSLHVSAFARAVTREGATLDQQDLVLLQECVDEFVTIMRRIPVGPTPEAA
jgi:hypothetical protein